MHIPTIFSEVFFLELNRTIDSIITDKLLIKGKEGGKDLFQQTGTCRTQNDKASDKIYFKMKETMIIIFDFILII